MFIIRPGQRILSAQIRTPHASIDAMHRLNPARRQHIPPIRPRDLPAPPKNRRSSPATDNYSHSANSTHCSSILQHTDGPRRRAPRGGWPHNKRLRALSLRKSCLLIGFASVFRVALIPASNEDYHIQSKDGDPNGSCTDSHDGPSKCQRNQRNCSEYRSSHQEDGFVHLFRSVFEDIDNYDRVAHDDRPYSNARRQRVRLGSCIKSGRERSETP